MARNDESLSTEVVTAGETASKNMTLPYNYKVLVCGGRDCITSDPSTISPDTYDRSVKRI